jgi:hypothetical protein
MHAEDFLPISLRMAASLACRELASDAHPEALDAAAEALARLLTIYQEKDGRLHELPLEHRVHGRFEGGAARFVAAGMAYRRLYVRRNDLERALADLGSALAAVPQEKRTRDDRARRP